MPLPVDYPEEVCFSCTECGDCCRSWDVLVGPGERDRLAALEWHGREADLVGARVVEPVGGRRVSGASGLAPSPAAPPRHRLARGADGACVYLGAENRCSDSPAVRRSGEAAPVSTVSLQLLRDGGADVGRRVVLLPLGQPGRWRADRDASREWTRLLASRDLTDTRQHELRANVRVDGGLVWEVEQHHLLQFLKDDSLTLIERVRCVLQFVRLATTGDPDQPTASALRAAMAKGIPLQVRVAPLEATMDRRSGRSFTSGSTLRSTPRPHRSTRCRPWSRRKCATRANGPASLSGSCRPAHVDGNELAVDFGRIAAVDTSVFAENNCAPLRDFLCAKIVGQKFLIAGEDELPLVEATLMFLLTVPMTIWTAKALAAERGATAVEACDLRQAIRLIDRTLGQISTSLLPPKQREAYDRVMLETDLVEAATADVLVG